MTQETNSQHAAPEDAAPVLATVRQRTGLLELNRPRALNSLNDDMVRIILTALDKWREDDSIDQVIIYSNHPKAFCAGGDVRYVRETVLDGHDEASERFFADEYRMNGDLAEYPKPLIALIDGVVMGGGLGISAHGSHRVVTENAFASMPEMAIGYFTDVAGGYMAQRMVGTRGVASPALAKYWAITGYRMHAADMLYSGLATHYVADIAAFREDIIAVGVDGAVDKHATQPAGEPPLAQFIDAIESTFDKQTWPGIASALEAADPEFAQQTNKLLAGACPTSIVSSIELLRLHEDAENIRAALDNEIKLSRFMRIRDDFAEGVRAVLVDKTRDATFHPATTDEVDVGAIRAVLS